MTPGPVELTDHAYALAAAGDLAGARAVLEQVLGDGPTAAQPTRSAASLYARVLLADGQPAEAYTWAAYAHTASLRLHGAQDSRTIRDAATLAAALHRTGDLPRAERQYREVVRALAATEGPGSAAALAARADLATVLHAAGHFDEARAELSEAVAAQQTTGGPGDPAAIRMLARLAEICTDAGDLAAAHDYSRQAQRLAAVYLPASHPVARLVDALAETAPPARPHPAERDDSAEHDDEVASVDPPATAPAAPHGGTAVAPGVTAIGVTDPPAAGPDDGVPLMTPRPMPAGELWQAYPPPRRGRWLLAAALALVALAGTAAVVFWPRGGVPVAQSPTTAPATSGVPQPVGGAGGARLPAEGTAPQQVRLSDHAESVTLSWRYPAGADGPVVVSGGRKSTPVRAFQTLPPGETHYTVHGLTSRVSYCFVVAVAYSTELVAKAEPVCTKPH